MRFQSDSTASNTTLTLETDSLTARRGVIDPNDRATLYKLLADMPSGDYEPVIFNNPVLKGLTLITASQDQVSKAVGYFVVEDTLRSIIGNWNQIFDEIYWLLSLASANHISFPVTYIQGEKGVEIQIEKTVDAYGGNRTPPLPLSQPGTIAAFLDSTIDQYRSLLNQFELNRLIGYYIEMRAAAATEIEYLIGSVFMEAQLCP